MTPRDNKQPLQSSRTPHTSSCRSNQARAGARRAAHEPGARQYIAAADRVGPGAVRARDAAAGARAHQP